MCNKKYMLFEFKKHIHTFDFKMCWPNLVSGKCHNAKFNVAKHINLYFRLRFGLVKAIIAYLRFKICIL